MTNLKIALVMSLPALLMACGGGSTGGSGLVYGTDVTFTPSDGAGSGTITSEEFAALGDAYDALETAIFVDNTYEPTEPTGTADMTGYIAFSEDGNEDEAILGNLSLAVDFDNLNVTGSASDFAVYDVTGEVATTTVELTGTLNLLGAVAGSGLAADVTGDLSDGSDTYTMDLDLGGDVYDVDGTNIYLGFVDGGYTSSSGSDAILTGEFVAQ